MRLHGPSEANSRLRASLHAELQELREPDLSSPDDHWRAKQKDELCSAPFFKGNKDKAKQQWINEIKHTDSWEEGVEPNFSPQKVTQPKEIPEELAKYYRRHKGTRAQGRRHKGTSGRGVRVRVKVKVKFKAKLEYRQSKVAKVKGTRVEGRITKKSNNIY